MVASTPTVITEPAPPVLTLGVLIATAVEYSPTPYSPIPNSAALDAAKVIDSLENSLEKS